MTVMRRNTGTSQFYLGLVLPATFLTELQLLVIPISGSLKSFPLPAALIVVSGDKNGK